MTNPLPPLPAGDVQAFSREFHGPSFGMVWRVPKKPKGTEPARENFTGYYLPPGDDTTVQELHAYYVDGAPNACNNGLTPAELAEHRGHPISGDWTTKHAASSRTMGDLPANTPTITPKGALF